MSRENIIISLDGHTEVLLDLSKWIPRDYLERYGSALEEGERTFKGASRYFADMVFAGSGGAAVPFETANELHLVDTERYHEVLTCEQRLANIDADGIAAEMLIDSFGAMTSDPDLQHQIALAWCRWFKDYTAPAPYRFAGGVIVTLTAGIETVVSEIAFAYDQGLAAIHLPGTPKAMSPWLPEYNHGFYEPMWRALDERGMAVLWHGGCGRDKPMWRWNGAERGWEALMMIDMSKSHQQSLKYFLLAGIPERYPSLLFGYVEDSVEWIPGALAELDYFHGAPTMDPAHKLKMSASEQWARQGFAAGTLDRKQIAMRDKVGVANMTFGSDYIHTEGTYPSTRKHLANVLADLPEQERWAIVAGNAARMFGFDLDKLAQTPAAQDPWFPASAAA